MLGASELPLRQGFACGKTLVRRKRVAPPCGAPVLSAIYTLRTSQKETPADRLVFLFGFRRARLSCAMLHFASNLCRTRGGLFENPAAAAKVFDKIKDTSANKLVCLLIF